jgi:hypothetical protein
MKKIILLSAITITLIYGCKKTNFSTELKEKKTENVTLNTNNITIENTEIIANSIANIITEMNELNSTQVCHLNKIISNTTLTHQEKFESMKADPILNSFATNGLLQTNIILNAGYSSALSEEEKNEIVIISNDILFGKANVIDCSKAKAGVLKCNKDFQICGMTALATALGGGPSCLIVMIHCLYRFNGCVGDVAAANPSCFSPGGTLRKTGNFFNNSFSSIPSNTTCN